jgi:predicted nucleic acid-binding protein
MSSGPRIYSDANPIIELAKYAKKTHDPNRERDLWMMRQILRAAQSEEVSLFTSTISVAECVAAGDDWGVDVQEFFVGVLTSGRMFRLVQDSVFVAERARDLRWKDNIRLSGMDAIHVASALEAGCTEFLTWDNGIKKNRLAEKASALAALGLQVITPCNTRLLPPYYLSEQQPLIEAEPPTKLIN